MVVDSQEVTSGKGPELQQESMHEPSEPPRQEKDPSKGTRCASHTEGSQRTL